MSTTMMSSLTHFQGVCQARFHFQELLTIVKPGDMIDVMDVSHLTSNARELYCLLDYLEDLHVTIYSDNLILDEVCVYEWFTALMLCKAEKITRNQHNFNQQKMCQLKHQVNSIQNKDQSITQRDYQIYDLLMSSDYKTVQKLQDYRDQHFIVLKNEFRNSDKRRYY